MPACEDGAAEATARAPSLLPRCMLPGFRPGGTEHARRCRNSCTAAAAARGRGARRESTGPRVVGAVRPSDGDGTSSLSRHPAERIAHAT
eukprot:355908-Chlamydomonas_euryale.AAC.7